MKTRYHTLLELIAVFKPQSIVEIGAWSGDNAIRMIQAAHQHHEKVDYIGYDLFEDATAQTDAEEFNVKEHHTIAEVKAKIEKACPYAEVTLIKGNTRQTLKKTIRDFVFIDGGHSVETILNDYQMVAGSSVIVFDDFYSPLPNGQMPDIQKIGCNLIVAELPHAVIPSMDVVRNKKNGPQVGFNGLAVVFGS